jgi:hypothetical protein
MGIPVLHLISFRDYCFYPRKHRLAQWASILARNVINVLLMVFRYHNGHTVDNCGVLLTVAGQPVIFTRFLFKSSACAPLTCCVKRNKVKNEPRR